MFYEAINALFVFKTLKSVNLNILVRLIKNLFIKDNFISLKKIAHYQLYIYYIKNNSVFKNNVLFSCKK